MRERDNGDIFSSYEENLLFTNLKRVRIARLDFWKSEDTSAFEDMFSPFQRINPRVVMMTIITKNRKNEIKMVIVLMIRVLMFSDGNDGREICEHSGNNAAVKNNDTDFFFSICWVTCLKDTS